MPNPIACVEWKGEDAHAALPCLARLLNSLAREVGGEFTFLNPITGDLRALPFSTERLLMLRDEAHEAQARSVQQETFPMMRALLERMVAITEHTMIETPEYAYIYEIWLRDSEGKPKAGVGLRDVVDVQASEGDADLLLQRARLHSGEWEGPLVQHAALFVALSRSDTYACGGTKRRVWTLVEPQSDWIEE